MEQLAFSDLLTYPGDLPEYRAAVEVVRRLRGARHEAYLVGGGVRDLVMGVRPKDFDIVTSARPEETQALFPRSRAVGAQFGVITVIHENHDFEVATFRTEGDYEDGRRPGWVEFSDLDADLARRDFTFNGLTLDPDTELIADPVGGLADMRRALVRCIGAPEDRFREDALRMLRAIRFAARFGYRLERSTRAALVACVGLLGRVARERVLQELNAMWADPNRSAALALLCDTGVLAHVIPAFREVSDGTAGYSGMCMRTRRRIEALPADVSIEVVWASLLADVVCPQEPTRDDWDEDGPYDPSALRRARKAMAVLRAGRNTARSVAGILARRWVWSRAHSLRRGSLARLIRRDPEGDLVAFWNADAAASGRASAADPLNALSAELRRRGRMLGGPNGPPVTGDVLLERGFEPGPEMRNVLAEAERKWLEDGGDAGGECGATA